MNKKKIIKEVKKIARKVLEGESSGHDFSHVCRVYKMAFYLGKKEKADLFVLSLAALLHDIDVKKGRDNHNLRSAKASAEILEKLGVDKKIIKQVQACIRSHSYRGAKDYPAKTLEAKIISDADKLDVMGAIGVARICSFAGHFGRPLHDPNYKLDPERYATRGGKTAIGAFYEKVFLLPKVLHTRTAKQIGKKRLKFAHQFVKKFLQEWQGEI